MAIRTLRRLARLAGFPRRSASRSIASSLEALEGRLCLAASLFDVSASYDIGTPAGLIVSGSLDGDGFADFAVASASEASFTIRASYGIEGPAQQSFITTAPVSAIAFYEPMGDGIPSLAVLSTDGRLQTYFNYGWGSLSPMIAYDVPAGGTSLVAADFNGDESIDFAVASPSGVTLLLSHIEGHDISTLDVGGSPSLLLVGQFDNDPAPDLAVANSGAGTLQILANDGAGEFTIASTFPLGAGPSAIVQADFDGDEHTDLAIALAGDQAIQLFLGMTGNALTEGPTLELGTTPAGLAVGDFNNDFTPDLVAIDAAGLVLIPGFGDGSFAPPVAIPAPAAPAGLAAGQFDDDSLNDLAVSSADGFVRIFSQQPIGTIDATGGNFSNPGLSVADLAIAGFTDADSTTTAAEYSALIHWDEGPAEPGAVVWNATTSQFDIIGSHDYGVPANYYVTIDILHESGRVARTASRVDVSAGPIEITPQLPPTFIVDEPLEDYPVATFVDSGASSSAADFTATINWGDGTVTPGTVSEADGYFIVSGTHTYTAGGQYTARIDLEHTDGRTATADAPITILDRIVAFAVPVYATAGVPFSAQQIAWFGDTEPETSATEYTVTIDWGDDSSPSAGTVTSFESAFQVLGDHAYATDGDYTITVSILHDASGRSTSVTTTATVIPGEISIEAQGRPVIAIKGVRKTHEVARFTVGQPPEYVVGRAKAAADCSATIRWGDGTSSAGRIVASGEGYSVRAAHAWRRAGEFEVEVIIQPEQGQPATAGGLARVVNSAAFPIGRRLVARQRMRFDRPVLAFIDGNPLADARTWTARIEWGDGAASRGIVRQVAPGVFAVMGRHAYAARGRYAIRVTLLDSTAGEGQSVIGQSRIAVR